MQVKLNQFITLKTLVFALMAVAVIALSGRPSGMLTGHPIVFDLDTDNYVGTHNFQVTIENSPYDVINTEFLSFKGAHSRTEEGKKGQLVTIYEPVVVGRVYKGVDALYGWRRDVENGILNKYDITIVMMDAAFVAKRSWTLINAWPSQWQLPDMDASSSGPDVEKMVFNADEVYETAP